MSDDLKTDEPEKQTNRTFDQSDVDRLIAKEKNSLKEKYADYEKIKDDYTSLLEREKQRELESMSEVDKIKAMLSEKDSKLVDLENSYTNLLKEQTKTDVLSQSKYSKMPRAYKQMVSAFDTKEAVIESADEIYKEYQADFGISEVAPDFDSKPIAKEPTAPTVALGSTEAMKEKYNNSLLSRISGKL
jgi:myosin heavy subunit